MLPEERLDESIKQARLARESTEEGGTNHERLSLALHHLRIVKRVMEIARADEDDAEAVS